MVVVVTGKGGLHEEVGGGGGECRNLGWEGVGGGGAWGVGGARGETGPGAAGRDMSFLTYQLRVASRKTCGAGAQFSRPLGRTMSRCVDPGGWGASVVRQVREPLAVI